MLSSLCSSYNPACLLSFVLLGILSVAKGGREIIGLGLYHIFSLLIFYASLRNGRGELIPPYRQAAEGIHLPVLTFLAVCAVSTVYSIFTQQRGLVHFATILIHAMNFYSFLRIKDELFEARFFHLAVLFSAVLSLGILWQFFSGGISTFFFPNKNLLAEFLNCGILIALSLLIRNAAHPLPLWKKSTLYSAAGMLFFTELTILSRGALFSLCCALIFLAWWEIKAKRFHLVFLMGTGAAVAFLHPDFRNTFYSKMLFSLQDSRIVIYQTAWNAFMQKPFFGWGLGSFSQVYDQFKMPIESDIARYEKTTAFAHNEFLELLVETGILGLGTFCWLIAVILKTGFSSLKTTDSWSKVAAFTCTISLLTHALLDFNLHLPILAYLLMACAAVLVPSGGSPPPEKQESSRPLRVGYSLVLLSWGLVCLLALFSELFATYAGSQKQKGNLHRAAQFYRISSLFNPLQSQNFYELAQLSSGNEKEKWLKKAIRTSPGNSNFYRDLGLYYLQQQKIELVPRKLDFWKSPVGADVNQPNWANLHSPLQIHKRQLAVALAIECYRKAIEKNPKKVFYYGELAQTYLWLGQTEKAQALFQQAIQIEPFYLLAHQKLAELYLLQGNKKLSEKHLLVIKNIRNAKLNPLTDYSKRLLE